MIFAIAKKYTKFPQAIYFVSIFLLILLTLTFLIYEIHKRLTISAKKDYIGLLSTNIISTDQSMDELLSSLTTTNNHYKQLVVVNGEDGVNFEEIINNNQASILQIEGFKDNLQFQKKLISSAKTPKDYDYLRKDFYNYYDESSKVLSSFSEKFETESNILKSLDTNVLDINLTRSDLWESANEQRILTNFKRIDSELERNLAKLETIQVSQNYLNYRNLHREYLQTAHSASQEIITILENSVAGDNTSSVELALKSATESQIIINEIAKKIYTTRTQTFSLKENIDEIEKIANAQKSLESEIKILYQQLYEDSKENSNLLF